MNVEEFTALHEPGRPLLLANAWDLASARYLHDSGFPVVATTSAGVSYGANKADAAGETLEETLALARACTAAGIPLTVDMESGFGTDPAQVAGHVAEFAALGVLGVNIEDGQGDGTLRPLPQAVDTIAEIVRAVPGIFVNARTDAYWSGGDDDPTHRYDLALERALAYREAGAHGIFVPGVSDPDTIGRLTDAIPAPVNILFQPSGPSFGQLAELGVGRVSVGSMLFRLALDTIVQAARAVRESRYQAPDTVPTYADLND